jgi:hypothetical protein
MLRQAGAMVIAIGIGSHTDTHELQQIASDQGYVYNVADFDYLDSISAPILDYLCASKCSEMKGKIMLSAKIMLSLHLNF